MGQIFNALSGQELKKAILADIEKELELTGEFKQHMTFPWVRYEATVKVLSYPKQALDAEPAIKIEAKGEMVGDGAENISESARPEVILDLSIADVMDTPDKARVQSGQPIPTQARQNGVLVDKPVHRIEPAVAPVVEQVKPRNTAAKIEAVLKKAATNHAEGSPVGIPGIDPAAQ